MLNTLLYIVIGLVLAGVILLLYKYPIARLFVLTAVMVVLVFTGITSAFRLNTYYNSKGGIIGQITGVYKENEVEITETTQIDFDFKNVSLTKNENDKYSAKFSTEKTLTLNDNEFYQILVNDEPAQLILSDKNSAVANYTYVFQSNEIIDNNYKEIAIDTMTISFSFYGNYSNIICEINGGTNTASLWDSYFTKNNFKISIIKVDNIKQNNQNLELKTITIYANNKAIDVIKVKKGLDYILPNTIDVNGYYFNYFEINGEKITKITNINEDIAVFANLTKICNVTVSANLNGQDFNSNYMGTYDILSGTTISEAFEIINENSLFKEVLDNRSLTGYEIIGFTTKEGFANDPSDVETNYVIESDIILYAVWQVRAYPVTVISNGSSYKVGDLDKNENFEFLSPYDYTLSLTFTNINVENMMFSHYLIYFTNYPQTTKIINEETISFSIKEIYTLLHNNYGSEYVPPEDRVEFEMVGNLVIEIHTKEYERSWTEDYTEEQLTQIAFYEKEISNLFGLYYDIDGVTVKFPIEELEFLKDLWHGITKEINEYTVPEYRQKIASFSLFSFEYEENINFYEYLELLYNASLKYM